MVQFKNNSREFKLRHKLNSDPICPHMESSIISDCTQLLLNFIHCRYKALLARRREPTETREYHRLTMRQRDSYHKKALSGLIASFDSANILVAPTSRSRSIRKHHRLVLKATCSLRGHLIGLPPIEADDPDNGSSRSLTPILFSNVNMVREANKLVACVYVLLILDQVPNSVRRAKIVYGDGFDVRYVVLRGKNGATRLATEARHVFDEFFKFLGDDSPPPTLRLNRHCDACEALKTVVRYLQSLETDRNGSSVNVEDASNVDSHSNHQFGTASFAIPEMRGLTKRAYFNYQRDRIFVRINPNVRRNIRRRTRRKVTVRVNKRVICEAPQACPTCE